jgi:phage tail sheath gpL-like
MPISFSHIPANWKMPLYWVELDSSKAGLPTFAGRSLVIGIMNSTVGTFKGSATPFVPVPIASQAQADALFGQGSMLSGQLRSFFANNWANEVWALPYPEPTGTKAVSTMVVTGTASGAGTLALYVAGRLIPVPVAQGDTATVVGASAVSACALDKDLPVTVTATGGTITFTAKFIGTSGLEITAMANYYGTVGGEQMPPGITLGAFTPTPATGTGDPLPADHDTAISALGEAEVDYVSLPFTDSTSLLKWETEFGFSDTGRWGFIRQHYGQIFSAKRDTKSNLMTLGSGRNNAQLSILGIEIGSPTPAYQWAAAYCAKAARALGNDPARPLQTLSLDSCLPAQSYQRFLLSELNAMALSGVATQRTITTVPVVMRESTTYVRNLYGNSDDAYELVTTPATLAKLLRNQRHAITSKYPRHKLADDGTRFGAGQAIVTPKIIKAELVAQYRIDEFNGLVENGKAFKDNLVVERDPNDPNRINVLYPPDLVNQLRVFAVLAQFRLQYSRGLDTVIAA